MKILDLFDGSTVHLRDDATVVEIRKDSGEGQWVKVSIRLDELDEIRAEVARRKAKTGGTSG